MTIRKPWFSPVPARIRWLALLWAFGTLGCGPIDAGAKAVPIVGLPCEGCEAIFQGLPQSLESIPAHTQIAGDDEPGERLHIEGTVREATGKPASGIVVYAYHTDDHGIYPASDSQRGTAAYRHGRLRGWARTDENGRYGFDTIRPSGYPATTIPAHIHMHILEPGRCTYYIDDILFEDDPRLTEQARNDLISGRGGPGVARPVRDERGVWRVERDIALGHGVPGYPGR